MTLKTLMKHRIDKDLYEDILVTQDGRCAICRKLPNKRRLSVDHSHVTAQIRGLLCGTCNAGLGMFKDSLILLDRAIQYLDSKTSYGEVI